MCCINHIITLLCIFLSLLVYDFSIIILIFLKYKCSFHGNWAVIINFFINHKSGYLFYLELE